MILVSVFDKKSSSYAPPVAFDHVSEALRSYIMFARQKSETRQIQFCEDYDLYDVGEFNQNNGAVVPSIPAQYIESMINIVAQARKEFSNGN